MNKSVKWVPSIELPDASSYGSWLQNGGNHVQSLTAIRLGEEGIGTNDAMGLPRRIARYWPGLFKNPQELLDPKKTPKEIPRWGEVGVLSTKYIRTNKEN
jgi:hypothetical protein